MTCPHKLLRKQLSGTQVWYVCECGQKFKAQEWDGKARVIEKAVSDYAHPFDKLPEDQLAHVNRWLESNEKKADQVRWSLYPIGMVGRWIERAIVAEKEAAAPPPPSRELAKLANQKEAMTGDWACCRAEGE